MTTEYPTLTALMQGREPGSVKVRQANWAPGKWRRVGGYNEKTSVMCSMDQDGTLWNEHSIPTGPWLIVSDDAHALDTLRLQMAATILSGLHAAPAGTLQPGLWNTRHAYALAETDALIKEARK